MAEDTKKSKRGFASMSAEQQREIASKGGRAAHEKGTAHQFNSAEASKAGKKGGSIIGKDRAHMAKIGRMGGQARGKKAAARAVASEQQLEVLHATAPMRNRATAAVLAQHEGPQSDEEE